MVIISTQEFREKQKKYFDLAEKERVIIKRGKKLVELVVSDKLSENPSPSGDTWFDDPENMASVMRGIEDIKAGRVTKIEDTKNIWKNIL
ncbi:hypothetical protein EZS27_021108 [termite gut metagenome]|uniref:Uncharacterized protein n=1 Tax=termite gut metagenome TaxID=433724 RepID=A0A5J4R833_9ZZZZ